MHHLKTSLLLATASSLFYSSATAVQVHTDSEENSSELDQLGTLAEKMSPAEAIHVIGRTIA